MKPLRKTITALLGYDRRERRGTFILSLLVVMLLLVRLAVLRPGRIPAELPPFYPDQAADEGSARESGEPARLFAFDPNTVGYDELVSLGLTQRQARTLVNYRNSGARFRRPEDLLKVYGIDSAIAARLIPYITIGEITGAGKIEITAGGKQLFTGGERNGITAGGKQLFAGGERNEVTAGENQLFAGGERNEVTAGENQLFTGGVKEGETSGDNGKMTGGPADRGQAVKRYPWSAGGEKTRPVDLNTCTAGELESLPGIGPVLAARIIRYRSLLGGFVDTGQLSEVYGLDSAVVRLAEGRLTLTFDSVRSLVLDSVTFGDLARHPYLGYEAARQITRYRSITGRPVTLGEMACSGVITPEQASRIAPYVRPPGTVARSDYEFISSKVLK